MFWLCNALKKQWKFLFWIICNASLLECHCSLLEFHLYFLIFCLIYTLPLYFLIMTKRGRYRIASLRGRRNFKQIWSFNYFKQWKILLRGSIYQKHVNQLQIFNWMHDIYIEFLIDIAKGEQSIKIPYLKGKKERIMKGGELWSSYIHVNIHSNLYIHAIYFKKINVLSSSKRGRLLTPEWFWW